MTTPELTKVQGAWKRFKGDTKTSQAAAAKAMGMNQSAFSQYLRGPDNNGIPLNTDFLIMFSRLVGEDLADRATKAEVGTIVIELKYTLSGATPIKRKLSVVSMVSTPNSFGVLVDVPCHLQTGSVLMVDPSDDIREGDMAVLVEDSVACVGTVKEDQTGWVLTTPTWGASISKALDKRSEIYRVVSSYYPQPKAKIVKLS